ncbi:Zn(2)-C6 fungal-type domain-containing protein [Mycena kentingensis (nom. inval.)]|nr:Zn(2)-C6 fungal-type domain-containing protein [Mycena kentingensis (nom. inval.)]
MANPPTLALKSAERRAPVMSADRENDVVGLCSAAVAPCPSPLTGDGADVDGPNCSICIELNVPCTYLRAGPVKTCFSSQVRRIYRDSSTAANPITIRSSSNYVQSLEAQLRACQNQVRTLRTQLAAAHFAAASPSTSGASSRGLSASMVDDSASSDDALPMDPAQASLHVLRTFLRNLGKPQVPPLAEDLEFMDIAQRLEGMAIGEGKVHFVGKSSTVSLFQTTVEMRAEALRIIWERTGAKQGMPMPLPTIRPFSIPSGFAHFQPWSIHSPYTPPQTQPQAFRFPSLPLILELTELYFANVNIYLPLLHRPTFQRSLSEEMHLRNPGFGATVLLVCAVGARWHPELGTGAPDDTPSDLAPELACGWAWFLQVPVVGNHLFRQATLDNLQHYCLAIQFLQGASGMHACWNLIGIGLRVAQDLGIHRRRATVEQPTIERELYKRAFWVLVFYDRIISCVMGRPAVLDFNEFDIDPIIECDDEYWEDPERPFQQPVGVPCKLVFFNAITRLMHILTFAVKLLYQLGKSRVVIPVTGAWEENIVVELDSGMNVWLDGIPDYLRWDPDRTYPDPVFFDQSVSLQCFYHYVQFVVHRPFVTIIRRASAGAGAGAPSAPRPERAVPSLTIITNAARSCANIVDLQRRKKAGVPVVFHFPAVFTAAMFLLLNICRDMANVEKCLLVMKLAEGRWQHAGILGHLLKELSTTELQPMDGVTRALPIFADLTSPAHANARRANVNANATGSDPVAQLVHSFSHSSAADNPSINTNGWNAPFPPTDPLWSTLRRTPGQGEPASGAGMDTGMGMVMDAEWPGMLMEFDKEWGAYFDQLGQFMQG